MSAPCQYFQHQLGRHLRDPHHVARPTGVPARRVAIYHELLFNNLCGFVDCCFPVCRELLGEARWRRLVRTFYRDWPLHTPWFNEIAGEFVRYLAEAPIRQPLPRWLAELARYEWAELAVDIMPDSDLPHDPSGDLLTGTIVLNPARLDLANTWPVHRITPDWRPRRPQPTQLVVYRRPDESVHCSELNAVTARLLALLAEAPTSGQQALQQIADELAYPAPAELIRFGADLLTDLRRQGILLGVTPS